MKTGVQLIAKERKKQIKKWGTTSAHDVDHYEGELKTAALYALTGESQYKQTGFEDFEESTDEKGELQRLVTAGALIAAEIDRKKQEFKERSKR